MRSFSYTKEIVEGGVCFEFSGSMDESMTLPDLSEYKNQIVTIDFENICFINSLGIRLWMLWMNDHEDQAFFFKALPLIIIDQMNVVEGFLPKTANIGSFYVPFYCENCDEETFHFFEEGKEFNWGERIPSEEELNHRECKVCQHTLETNIQEKKFFRFLSQSLQRKLGQAS